MRLLTKNKSYFLKLHLKLIKFKKRLMIKKLKTAISEKLSKEHKIIFKFFRIKTIVRNVNLRKYSKQATKKWLKINR